MHHLLVSDLISEEEFDKLVEKKSAMYNGILDEVAAALLVVADLGRAHVKIGDIPKAKSKIVCFFGKILSIDGPREFKREGEDEPGAVANIILGDPTGTTKMTLWDERAGAVTELSIGNVIEVIGQPIPNKREIKFVALRESDVEIVETKKPPTAEIMDRPFVVKILVINEVKEIERKDGSVSYLQEFLVGDESGTTRLTTWSPDTFSDVDEGSSVSITGVTRKEDDELVEYAALDTAVVSPHTTDINVLTLDVDDVEEGQMPIVRGTVESMKDARTFTTKKGIESKVRNIRIKGKKASIGVVLWGNAADTVVMPGDTVDVINAVARPAKFGGLELSVGYGSAMRLTEDAGEPIELSGTLVLRQEGLALETSSEVWILQGEIKEEPGTPVHITGLATNGRIKVSMCNPETTEYNELKKTFFS